MASRFIQFAPGTGLTHREAECCRHDSLCKGIIPVLLALILCCLAALPLTARAAAPLPRLELEEEAEYARAPVMLDGEALFVVRGIQAYPAEKRAQMIGERIRAVADEPSVPVSSLRVVETDRGSDVLAGDRFLLTVRDSDARLMDVARQFMAQAVQQRIGEAIATYRTERNPQTLLHKGAYATGATAITLGLLFLVWSAFRRLDGLFERRYRKRIEGFEAQAFRIIEARRLLAAIHGMISLLRTAVLVAVGYVYFQVVLELFPWSRPLSRRLGAIVLGPLASIGTAVLDAVPNLIFIAVLVLLVRYLLKLVHLYFSGIDSGTITLAGFDSDWAWPTYKIIRFATIAFTVVVAYPYIPGSHSPAFQGVSIFIGVIFSLGSSSFIANMIAGYSMTYRRAFRVGDRMRVGDVTGDVTEIGLMVTRIRTVKNEETVVPNSTILNSNIFNYSALAQKHGLILHTTVGIGYETPWRQVEAMLLLAADRTPGLLKAPPPFVRQTALGDFCVTYEINAYCDKPQQMALYYTELHRNILDMFNEYSVQIMTPAYEGDPEQPKIVPKDQWYVAPAKSNESAGQPARGALGS